MRQTVGRYREPAVGFLDKRDIIGCQTDPERSG
jgi:hypothetical protein